MGEPNNQEDLSGVTLDPKTSILATAAPADSPAGEDLSKVSLDPNTSIAIPPPRKPTLSFVVPGAGYVDTGIHFDLSNP